MQQLEDSTGAKMNGMNYLNQLCKTLRAWFKGKIKVRETKIFNKI